VVTNLPFLRTLAADPHFAEGAITTSLVESTIAPAWRGKRKATKPDAVLEMLSQIVLAEGAHALAAGNGNGAGTAEAPGPWSTLAGFRL